MQLWGACSNPEVVVELRRMAETATALAPASGGASTLLHDRTFQSPSYAAAFVLGRSANGRTEWKNANGVSLKTMAEIVPAQSPSVSN